jgi:glutathione S-transferase
VKLYTFFRSSTSYQGLVPALVGDDGKVYTQSMATIEWLDERYPDPPLMPRAADEKWYVRALSQIIGCEMHPLNNTRVLKYLKSAYGLDDTKVNGDWYPHWITMADICLVPQVFNAQRFDCDLKPYPTVMAIFERCMTLPAFSGTLPSKQGDAA